MLKNNNNFRTHLKQCKRKFLKLTKFNEYFLFKFKLL